jgi:hypothetical protein
MQQSVQAQTYFGHVDERAGTVLDIVPPNVQTHHLGLRLQSSVHVL